MICLAVSTEVINLRIDALTNQLGLLLKLVAYGAGTLQVLIVKITFTCRLFHHLRLPCTKVYVILESGRSARL